MGHGRRHEGQGQRQGQGSGGVPDGLLIGLLALGFALLILAWTATGFAGLLAHGGWPADVTFKNAPMAVRSLISSPKDLPAAWPDTPPGELSGYGLFWGIAISELMVLAVLTVFTLGTLARWKAVRAARREARIAGPPAPADPIEQRPAAAPAPKAEPSRPQAATGVWDPYGTTASPAGSTQPPGPADPAHPSALAKSSHPSAPATPARGPASAEPSEPSPVSRPPGDGLNAPVPSATPAQPHRPAGAPDSSPLLEHTTLPAPRAPRLLYGDPATRRPTTIQAVLDAEGPALVITSDPSVWSATKDARAKLGPVLVYDPGHLCDTPGRLHWSPTTRCENAETAAGRATALLAPVRPRALLDAAMADTAETLLRCWLHAAAVDGRPFKQVHRWAQGIAVQDAVRILRTHPKATAGLAGLLESALTAHAERREIAQQLVARALSSLSSIHIREACTPNRTDTLTLESFADEGGTLYLVGEPIEDPRSHPGAMPLLTALASDVVESARRRAARSSAGRLDPPMTLILDDVAAVAPLPLLPDLLATGQDKGLPTLVLLRSAEQARARWPEPLIQ
ncbi:type VI secretion protein [Streptomyces sp. NPDC055078]